MGKKIQRQINTWVAEEHDVRLFMHTTDYEPAVDLLPGEIFFYKGSGRLNQELNRISAARRLLVALEKFRPDIIYLRYGIYVYPLHQLFNIAPVVEDVTTNDLLQHQDLGRFFDFYNRLTRGLLLRHVEGLVSISHELAISPAFSVFHKPTAVIANGIDLDAYQPLPAPANSVPRLVFIGTPTAGFEAHGIDKLVRLAGHCADLQIDVIGYDGFRGQSILPTNITFHGYLREEHYRQLLAAADVALSSLGFHRIGLQEASPLKSREYLAYGLPMVVPYRDTDLDDLDLDVFLKIPNREDNVDSHAQSIRDFAYRMRGRRVDRAIIAPRIDVRLKEQQRLQFFEQVLSNAGK
ncbi:MAG TPA: hypothetical protein VHM28_01195 [Anaerolineales bacterium]|nr:hypothetical protein [Anaerolineales bacterium]